MTTSTARRTTAALGAIALGASLAVVATPTAYAADTTTTTTTTTGCATGALPDDITGRPADFKAGLPSGYWIWKDARGWHLRVTHKPGTRAVYAGTIRTTNETAVIAVRNEVRDRVWRSADNKTTAFRFVNYGGIDGLDFTPRCSANVTFTLTVNGKPIDPQKIHLGDADSNPAAATFTISRIATPA